MEGLVNNKIKKDAYLAAMAIIENPNTFTTGFYARDRNGLNRMPSEPEAVCWCSMGALELTFRNQNRFSNNNDATEALGETTEAFRDYIVSRFPKLDTEESHPVPYINDNFTHEAVVDIWLGFAKAQDYTA